MRHTQAARPTVWFDDQEPNDCPNNWKRRRLGILMATLVVFLACHGSSSGGGSSDAGDVDSDQEDAGQDASSDTGQPVDDAGQDSAAEDVDDAEASDSIDGDGPAEAGDPVVDATLDLIEEEAGVDLIDEWDEDTGPTCAEWGVGETCNSVTAQWPAIDAAAEPARRMIGISIEDPMVPNLTTFALFDDDGNVVPAGVLSSPDGRIFLLTVYQPLDRGETYTASFSGITAAGVRMEPYVWDFTAGSTNTIADGIGDGTDETGASTGLGTGHDIESLEWFQSSSFDVTVVLDEQPTAYPQTRFIFDSPSIEGATEPPAFVGAGFILDVSPAGEMLWQVWDCTHLNATPPNCWIPLLGLTETEQWEATLEDIEVTQTLTRITVTDELNLLGRQFGVDSVRVLTTGDAWATFDAIPEPVFGGGSYTFDTTLKLGAHSLGFRTACNTALLAIETPYTTKWDVITAGLDPECLHVAKTLSPDLLPADTTACTFLFDCNYACYSGLCLDSVGPSYCEEHDDCGDQEVCVGDRCTPVGPGCLDDRQCFTGYECDGTSLCIDPLNPDDHPCAEDDEKDHPCSPWWDSSEDEYDVDIFPPGDRWRDFDFERKSAQRGEIDGPGTHNGAYEILENGPSRMRMRIHFGTNVDPNDPKNLEKAHDNDLDITLEIVQTEEGPVATVTGVVKGENLPDGIGAEVTGEGTEEDPFRVEFQWQSGDETKTCQLTWAPD